MMPERRFWSSFLLATLATWRLTHLLAHEDGPAGVVATLRARVGNGLVGQLMDCFYCLTLWVAAPVAGLVARSRRDWMVTWLGLSGAASFVQRLLETRGDHPGSPTIGG